MANNNWVGGDINVASPNSGAQLSSKLRKKKKKKKKVAKRKKNMGGVGYELSNEEGVLSSLANM